MFGDEKAIRYDTYNRKQDVIAKFKMLIDNKLDTTQIEQIADKLWEQRTYAGSSCLFMSPIVIFIVSDVEYNEEKPSTQLEIKSKHFEKHFAFRARKCYPTSNQTASIDLCSIFVDEFGRFYQNWVAFMENNQYSEGLMVAPKKGVYIKKDGVLQLEINPRGKSLSSYLDIGASIFSVAAIGIMGGACLMPTMAAVGAAVATAEVIGGVCAGYSFTRGYMQLIDRKLHHQTVCVSNPDARRHWLSVSTSAVSLAISANRCLDLVNTSPRHVALANNIANGLQIASTVISSISILDHLNTFRMKRKSGAKISYAEFCSLATSLFVLTNSMQNYWLADQLIKTNISKLNVLTIGTLFRSPSLMNDIFDYIPFRHELLPGSDIIDMLQKKVLQFVDKMFSKCNSFIDFKLLLLNLVEQLTLDIFDNFMELIDRLVDTASDSMQKTLNKFPMENIIRIAIALLIDLDANNESGIQLIKNIIQDPSDLGQIVSKAQNIDNIKNKQRQNIRIILQKHRELAKNNIQIFFKNFDDSTNKLEFNFDDIDRVEKDLKQLKTHAIFVDGLVTDVIKKVRMNLSLEAYDNFFFIVEQFISNHASKIEKFLQRPIFIDVIVENIYDVILENQNKENLDEYLKQFESNNLSTVQNWITSYYENQITDVKSWPCPFKGCNGRFFSKTI